MDPHIFIAGIKWLFTTSEGLTLIIAGVTAWAAWESRKMAKISKLQYFASRRPLIGIDGVRNDSQTGLSLILKNYGPVITKHTITKMEVSGRNVVPKEMSASEHVMYPGQDYFVFLGPQAGNGSVVEFEIEYSDVNLPNPKFITNKKFSINGNTTMTINNHST